MAAPRHMEFLGQGSDPSHSHHLRPSCGHAGSLTHCAGLGIEPLSQCCRDIANPLPLPHNWNSFPIFKWPDIFPPPQIVNFILCSFSHWNVCFFLLKLQNSLRFWIQTLPWLYAFSQYVTWNLETVCQRKKCLPLPWPLGVHWARDNFCSIFGLWYPHSTDNMSLEFWFWFFFLLLLLLLLFLLLLLLCLCPRHAKIPRSGIEPTPQPWQHQILNL